MPRSSKVKCAVKGCPKEPTHLCWWAKDKGLIPHQMVCEHHFKELTSGIPQKWKEGRKEGIQ
jgi:hypothetical protein